MKFSDLDQEPAHWHGLTDAQVLTVFDSQDWSIRVMKQLRDIALDKRAHADQRVRALVELNKGMTVRLLPQVNHGYYPQLACAVLLAIGEGCVQAHGWRARRHQQKLEQRLSGLTQMMRTALQFAPPPPESEGAGTSGKRITFETMLS